MKKSILSIALCVALLMASLSVMFVMPASAAAEVNALDYEYSVNIPGSEDPASATVTKNADGSVTINFPKDDKSEVVFNLGEGAKVKEIPNVLVSLESTLKFDLCFYDANNSKYIMAAGDYYPQFNEQVAGSNASGIAAGKYEKVTFDLGGAYRWNAQTGKSDLEVPDNAVIVTIAIIPKGTGTMTINKLAMTDGMESFDLSTRGAVTEWDSTIDLIAGDYENAPAPTADDPQSNVIVTENEDGSVSYGNDNGMWPSAVYNFDEPIIVNESAALDLDFKVSTGCNTTIYLFMGPSTPDDFGDGAYIWVAEASDLYNTELGAGYYSGVVYLQDIIRSCIGDPNAVDSCYNEDGDFVINAVKIFATSHGGATNEAVKVNKVDLVYIADEEEETTTTEEETTTTTVVEDTVYVTYTLETVTHEGSIAAGEEITMNVAASATDDINGVSFRVEFDDEKFEFAGYEYAGVLAEIEASDNKIMSVNADNDPVDGVKEVYVTVLGDGAYDTTDGEVIFTFTLKAKVAIDEDVTVAITNPEVASDASTMDNYNLTADAVDGGIVIEAVEEPALKKGDLNGDGSVTIADAMQVFYHVAEKRIITNEDQIEAADVNGDETVTIADAMKIFYFVAEKIPSL